MALLHRLTQHNHIWSVFLITAVFASNSALAQARSTYAETLNVKNQIDAFRSVKRYAIGYVGFAGHISPEQILLENVSKLHNSEDIFVESINRESSIASKLYSLCGLKRMTSSKFDASYEILKRDTTSVSIFTGDILSITPASTIAERIKEFGCN